MLHNFWIIVFLIFFSSKIFSFFFSQIPRVISWPWRVVFINLHGFLFFTLLIHKFWYVNDNIVIFKKMTDAITIISNLPRIDLRSTLWYVLKIFYFHFRKMCILLCFSEMSDTYQLTLSGLLCLWTLVFHFKLHF